MMEEYLTCFTLELVEHRMKTILRMFSFEAESCSWLFRTIDAKGAPCHFSSTFIDCIVNRISNMSKGASACMHACMSLCV